MATESFEVVIVGAGCYGLAAAKTYLQIQPDVNLLVLDKASDIGGVWAEDLLYPGLKSNNLYGTYEFTDFDMKPFGAKTGEHVPGRIMHDYLSAYAERFGVAKRVRLNTAVESIEHLEGQWKITVAGSGHTIVADKLIMATGVASTPFVPDFKGSDTFGAPLVHSKGLGKSAEAIASTASRVTILGSCKAAYDAVYLFATSGVHVDWVIRKSGHGPGWMVPIYVTPLKIWLEKLVTTRLLTWFSPCIWGEADGYGWIRKFLHGTAPGRWFVDRFWGVLTDDVIQLNGYDKNSKTKLLKPWFSPFWVATSLSILNYPTNFFDIVKSDKVSVHVEDIDHLSYKTVNFTNGGSITSDALICGTGWRYRSPIQFLPKGIDEDLGLPYYSSRPDTEGMDADKEIFERFPRLLAQPTINSKLQPQAGDALINRPFRLHRFMIPPNTKYDRTFAFIGALTNLRTTTTAEIQALWIVAFLTGNLDIDKTSTADITQQRMKETVLTTQFCKRRYPGGFCQKYPDFVFDIIPYFDVLLKDLGLKHTRKSGLLSDIFGSYGVADYRGLVQEWQAGLAGSARARSHGISPGGAK